MHIRVRILQPSDGIIDRFRLSQLKLGLVYEVPSSIGLFLVDNRCAEEVPSSTPAYVVPLEPTPTFEHLTKGIVVVPPIVTADDRRA